MRQYCVAPLLVLATSLSAQSASRVEIAAPPASSYAAALSLLTDWGFPMQLAEEDNGVIVTNTLDISNVWIGNVRKTLLGQRPSYWLDCGKDWPFSLAASADYVNFQFTILITGDSSASIVKVKLLASAVLGEDGPLAPPPVIPVIDSNHCSLIHYERESLESLEGSGPLAHARTTSDLLAGEGA